MQKSKMTFTEEIMKAEGVKVSPGHYADNLDNLSPKGKIKVRGSYSPKEKRDNFFDSA